MLMEENQRERKELKKKKGNYAIEVSSMERSVFRLVHLRYPKL